VDGVVGLGVDWSSFIDWFSNYVEDSSEGFWADWDFDGVSSIGDALSSDESFGGVQSDGSDLGVTQVLCHFEDESVFGSFDFECVQNGGKFALELYVDYRSDDLGDFSGIYDFGCLGLSLLCGLRKGLENTLE